MYYIKEEITEGTDGEQQHVKTEQNADREMKLSHLHLNHIGPTFQESVLKTNSFCDSISENNSPTYALQNNVKMKAFETNY